MSRISRSAQKMWSLIGTDSRIFSAFRAASHCRPNALLRSQYTRPARILEPGVGCSSWHHSQTRQRYTTAVGRGGEKSDDASGKPNLSRKDEDVVEFMEDEVDLEELEYDENSFTVDQVDAAVGLRLNSAKPSLCPKSGNARNCLDRSRSSTWRWGGNMC